MLCYLTEQELGLVCGGGGEEDLPRPPWLGLLAPYHDDADNGLSPGNWSLPGPAISLEWRVEEPWTPDEGSTLGCERS